jgi:hypothetical protein
MKKVLKPASTYWVILFMKLLPALFVSLTMIVQAQNPEELSRQLLEGVQYNRDVNNLLLQLASYDADSLADWFQGDNERKAFWMNVYNATVQLTLKHDTTQYKKRMAFYNKKAIVVAGKHLSPNDIEHGILRKSQWIYGLGYIRKWFPGSFEKKMRVRNLDPRIHFALNCGARSCPRIMIYSGESITRDLDLVTKSFLQQNTRLEGDELIVTKLFSWYQGDFGGKKGIIQFLVDYHILGDPSGFSSFEFDDYDWTLQLDMYR